MRAPAPPGSPACIPKKTEGADIHAGISADQIAAKAAGAVHAVWFARSGHRREHTWQAAAIPVTAAPIPIPFPGAVRPRPTPWRLSPRALFERLFGDGETTDPAARMKRMKQDRTILDFVRGDVSRLQPGLGRARQEQARRIPRRHPRYRAPHSEGGRAERHHEDARSWNARVGIPETLRRARQADERSDGDRLPDRHDARGHLHDGARRQQPQLSRDRRAGRTPLRVAPPERPGEDRQAAEDRRASCEVVRLSGGAACKPRRMATARCSTTPCFSTAAASATATCTIITICRWCWRAASR